MTDTEPFEPDVDDDKQQEHAPNEDVQVDMDEVDVEHIKDEMYVDTGEDAHKGESEFELAPILRDGVLLDLIGLKSQSRFAKWLPFKRFCRRVTLQVSPDLRFLVIAKYRNFWGTLKEDRIPILSVREIRVGQSTYGFQRFGNIADDTRSFSIMCHNAAHLFGGGKNVEYNLVCESTKMHSELVLGLIRLIDVQRKQQDFYSFVRPRESLFEVNHSLPNTSNARPLKNPLAFGYTSLMYVALRKIGVNAKEPSREPQGIPEETTAQLPSRLSSASSSTYNVAKTTLFKRSDHLLLQFKLLDVDGDNQLSVSEMKTLLKQMRVGTVPVDQIFQAYDVNMDGKISEEEFRNFVKNEMYVAAFHNLFKELLAREGQAVADAGNTQLASSDGEFPKEAPASPTATLGPPLAGIDELFQKTLSVDTFHRFLVEDQHETGMALETAKYIVSMFSANEERLDFEGFTGYMASIDNQFVDLNFLNIYSNMSLPLSRYLCNSSHNTYLVDDQLIGRTSVESYIKTYEQGYRCVEIDCWDGPNNEPIIKHGFTVTEKMTAVDFARITAKYAFNMNQWPLIISLENHCSKPQQRRLYEIFHEHLGDKLYLPKLHNPTNKVVHKLGLHRVTEKVTLHGSKRHFAHARKKPANGLPLYDRHRGDLPSPMALRCKILIKAQVGENAQVSEYSLASLVSLFIEKLEGDDDGWESMKHRPNDSMLNIPESQARQVSREDKGNCRDMTEHKMIRVYPTGTRFNSSNMDPLQSWASGCQLVAMNAQKSGQEMRINHVMFQANGGFRCGYILKDELLPPMIDPNEVKKRAFQITVISGHHLPSNRKVNSSFTSISPFVEILTTDLMGSLDTASLYHTNVVKKNGFNPLWNDTFNVVVRDLESTMILFTVRDKLNSTAIKRFFNNNSAGSNYPSIAFAGCKVRHMKRGVRSVPLYNRKGAPIGFGCHLVVRIEPLEDDLAMV